MGSPNVTDQSFASHISQQTPFTTDATALRPLNSRPLVSPDPENASSIEARNLARSLEFERIHDEYQVNRVRKFLMKNSNDISTIYSASTAESSTAARVEFFLDNCLFEELSMNELLTKLAPLKSCVPKSKRAGKIFLQISTNASLTPE